MIKIILNLFMLAVIALTAYHYRDYVAPYVESIKNVLHPITPCKDVITYSLGTFDDRFDISKEKLMKVLADAEEPWEEAEGKDLFQYSATGTMKVNLIYDNRQEATEKMQNVGIAINDDKATYDELKSRYDTLTASFNTKKAAFDKKVSAFNTRKAAYEKKVDYYNERGGAPEGEYQQLKQEEQALNAEAASITRAQDALNNIATDVNETITVLNNVAKKLNLKVETYNTIGASTGEEFSEGEYERDNAGTRINIYQFEDEAKLRRVLVHELGHALGLNHVQDPKAIMYYLNTSANEELTAADLVELKTACGKN